MGERLITPAGLAGDLASAISRFDKLNPDSRKDHLPVLKVGSVCPRVDKGSHVFEEAEKLFGIEVAGRAQAGTIIAAVPHNNTFEDIDHFIAAGKKSI